VADDIIEDGFGNRWHRCLLGAECSLQIVRPGKVQCDAYPVDGEFGVQWVDPCVWGEADRG
jgi:hypothetical protein